MAISVLTAEQVLAACHKALDLAEESDAFDGSFVAGLLRHTAGIYCPCSAATLRSVVVESLQHLLIEQELATKLDNAIEALIIGGDLLELNQVTTDDPSVKGTWLFAAPPSFVVRPSGSIFLIGVVADRDTFLPSELMSRIRHDGYTRAIMPESDEKLDEELLALGLQRLTQENWLRAPRNQKPDEHRDMLSNKLRLQPRSGAISDLQILDSSTPVSYYRGRWTKPKHHSGMYVGRRPQEYGSPIWCFVELEGGQPLKLLDFPIARSRWRGCDEAWRLQIAIDHVNGVPQNYLARKDGSFVYLDFYSPLPMWAEKRLMLIGRHEAPHQCLISYRVPIREFAAEEEFLKNQLWLAPIEATATGEG